jgi:dolichol-phosphate mannosyltransferase
MNDSKPIISIVVPLFNEEESIESLVARLAALATDAKHAWEFVFVDDGSKDRTLETLERSLDRLPRWKVVKLSRNFGQQSAYRAGLDAASGDAVVFLDADLQDPPERIPDMIDLWRSGARLVVGQRSSRAETGLRRVLFDLFHRLFFWVTNGAMPKDSGTFGLMDRAVVEELKRLPESNLFLPALRCWVGFQQAAITYDRAAREGQPKQSLGKLFNYAWDGITSFSIVPLKLISVLGLALSFGGFTYAVVLIAIKLAQMLGYFRELVVPGFTTLAVAVFFIGGVQLVCLGLIGEYLAKVYREVKGRPHYIIEHQKSKRP